MTYKDKLSPWCIIHPVSHVQMRIVGRFRRRGTFANPQTTDAGSSF
jgi:hypothetical protein